MSKEPKDKKQDAAEIDLQEFVTEHGLSLGDIPRDPETGQILYDQLTDEQREDLKRLNESAERMTAAATKTMKAKERADENKRYKEKINEYYKAAGQAISTESIQRLSESLGKLMQMIINEKAGESWRALIEILKPVSDLIGEIYDNRQQLDEELKKDCYDGRTIDDYLDNYTPSELLALSRDEGSDLYKALQATRAARASMLPAIYPHKTDVLHTPVDRYNFLAFNSFKETGGQIAFNLMSDRDKRDPDRKELTINMRYSLTFGDDTNLKTTKELTHFDRRLLQAIDSLFKPGADNVFLIGDISEAMGGKRSPSESRRNNIYGGLTKLGTARVFMDNAAEADFYNYPHFVYDGIILDFERVKVYFKGQEVTAVKVNRRPVSMAFADERKQITKIPIKVIQSGVSQTNRNLQIEDYILHRIVRQKNELKDLVEEQRKKYSKKRQEKINSLRRLVILSDTFHEKINTDGKKAIVRERAEKTLNKYLNHYANCKYIESYEIDKEAGKIIITLPIN